MFPTESTALENPQFSDQHGIRFGRSRGARVQLLGIFIVSFQCIG